MKARKLVLGFGASLLGGILTAELKKDEMTLDTDAKKTGYAIGKQIGSSIKTQGIDVDTAALKNAIDDILAGKPLAQSDEDSHKAMVAVEQKIKARLEQVAKENVVKGEKFLADFKAKYAKEPSDKQVQALPSGVLYRVVNKGSGKESPTVASKVKVNYAGRLIDGTEFDSSYKRNMPAEFPVSQVIRGWTEVLQKMKVGDKFEVAIPSQHAYGEAGSPPRIPPNSVLVFDMELLGIENPSAPIAPAKK